MRKMLWSCFAAIGLTACQSTAYPPIALAPKVDIPRFMGDWYVIANIPTFVEKGAHNAIESYKQEADGSIATTFTFRADRFDGPLKRYQPRGFVSKENPAVWGMQFIWPFEGDYRIVYLDEAYSQTIIGREKRDYVWIMARTPSIAEADYQRMVKIIADQGYDISLIQRVPQKW